LDHERREMSEKHETTSATMRSTILSSTADIAPGRAEEPISFPKKIHFVNFFGKRNRMYHAAAGESGRLSR
jgi:hypothetical protein